MKKLIVAVATGLVFSGQLVPSTAAAQATQTEKATPAPTPFNRATSGRERSFGLVENWHDKSTR